MIFPVTLAINWCQSPSQRYQIGDSWWYAPVNPHPHQSPFFHGESVLSDTHHHYTLLHQLYPVIYTPICDISHRLSPSYHRCNPHPQSQLRRHLHHSADGAHSIATPRGWCGGRGVAGVEVGFHHFFQPFFLVFGWGFNMVYPTNIFFVMVSDRWWWLMMHLEAIDGPFVLFGDYHNHDPWNS